MNSSFDINLALHCARLIADAYRGPCNIVEGSTDTQCNVLTSDSATFIVFPGTASLRDWITDAEAWRKNLDLLSVHAGFNDAVESVLFPILDAIKGSDAPLIITGHSLGGALADLCAFKLARLRRSIANVYTFGAPRVGNAAFARKYNCDWALGPKTFRCVNQADIVPWLPALLIPPTRLGYRHHATEVYLDGEHAITGRGLTTVELIENGVDILGALRNLQFAPLHEHTINAYIAELWHVQLNSQAEEVVNA